MAEDIPGKPIIGTYRQEPQGGTDSGKITSNPTSGAASGISPEKGPGRASPGGRGVNVGKPAFPKKQDQKKNGKGPAFPNRVK